MKYNEIWKRDVKYGDVFFERAVGIRDEMESSKAVCKILSPIYKKDMKILDVGCGAGHYLRSLKERIDNNINYVGVDITEEYLEKARKAFKDYLFTKEDIHHLTFKNNSFDVVMCNNVILHLPPYPKKAISELLRVSSDYVIIRTPCGMRNYIIKEIKGDCWNFLNLYTVEYIKDAIKKIDKSASVEVVPDVFWKELRNVVQSDTKTEIIDGRQVSGNIILDWTFFIIKKGVKDD